MDTATTIQAAISSALRSCESFNPTKWLRRRVFYVFCKYLISVSLNDGVLKPSIQTIKGEVTTPMSGLEVVSLVLGCIPLVISGLEHYAEGVRTIKRIMRHSSEYERLAHRIRAESVVFQNTLEILLGDCAGFDLKQRRVLLEDVKGEEWSHSDHKAALRARLQDSYHPFVVHVRGMHLALQEVLRKMHIGADGKMPFSKTDPNSLRSAYRVLKFALGDAEYQRLIDQIVEHNTLLRTLTEQSGLLLKLQQEMSKATPEFDDVRTMAAEAFASLQRGIAVSCQYPHRASIYVGGTRSDTQKSIGYRKASETSGSFLVILSHGDHEPRNHTPIAWSTEETVLRRLCASAPADLSNLAGSQALEMISDLCTRISQTKAMALPQVNELGYLSCDAKSYRYGLYLPERRLTEPFGLRINKLDSVLGSKNQACRLTVAETRKLATALAFGMLQFHDTHWLRKDWSKRDVTVLSDNGKVLGQHAFLSSSLGTPRIGRLISEMSPVRNEVLFAFGILLIELSMGKSIDELHPPEYLNPDGTKKEHSDFYTAGRLLRTGEIQDHVGKTWSDIIDRCIYCNLGCSRVSFEDSDFRKLVYKHVVAELEDDARRFCGI